MRDTTQYTRRRRAAGPLRLLAAFVFLVGCGARLGGRPVAAAPPDTPKTHVLLLDTSGSMKSRYAGGLKDWLVRPMLQSGAFVKGDEVIVRVFHTGGDEAFNPNDRELRKLPRMKFDEAQVLGAVPGAVTPFDTDIPKALRLALADLKGYGIRGDVLIWLVTDNVQDVGDQKDVTPLYETLIKDKNFRAVYLYPLLNDRSLSGAARGEKCNEQSDKPCAMLMYLMHYAESPPALSKDWLEKHARAVGQKINNPAVHWLPFEQTFDLAPQIAVEPPDGGAASEGENALTVESEPSPLFISEGEVAQVNVPLNIELRGSRRSVSGRISDPKFSVVLPPSVVAGDAPAAAQGGQPEAAGDESAATGDGSEVAADSSMNAEAWAVIITPQDLALDPNKKVSAHNIEINLPRPLGSAGFFRALLDGESETFTGTFQFNLDDLQTKVELDDAKLDQVANSEGIQRIFQQSVRRDKPFAVEVPLRVAFDQRWRATVLGVVAALLLAVAGAVAALLLLKSRYELVTPSGERTLALPVVGSQSIMLDGRHVATVSKKFGSLKVTPQGGFTIGGARGPRPLTDDGDFVLESEEDGRRYPHALRRAGKSASVAVQRDDFLD